VSFEKPLINVFDAFNYILYVSSLILASQGLSCW
jgi:hypothetical protein